MGSRRRILVRVACVILLLTFCAPGNGSALSVMLVKGGSDAPISGPSSGNLVHDDDDYIDTYAANVNVTNFIADAVFYNPYSTTKGKWDYGFLFRRPEASTFQVIRVTSEGTWDHHVVINKKWSTVGEGKVSGLRTGASQYNHLRIIILGDSGTFYVNGTFVNAELVRLGLAKARGYPPDTKYQDLLEQQEKEARQAGRGMWAK